MPFSRQASRGLGMEWISCLHFDLSLAMAIHSSKSFEMPLLLSVFSNVLLQVICGQPIGRECDTQPVSNCRGARLMGIQYPIPDICTIQCIYWKNKAQGIKTHNHRVLTEVCWRCTKQAARARSALLIVVPSHPVKFPLPRKYWLQLRRSLCAI